MQISFVITGLLAQLSVALIANPIITPAPSLAHRQLVKGRDFIQKDPRDSFDQSLLPGYCTENLLCYQGCFQHIVPKGRCLGCPGCGPLQVGA